MTNKSLEIFVGNASYRLATEILEKYEGKGFDYYSDDDVKQVRKVNTSADLLEELGDERCYELRTKVDKLIKFFPKLRIVK